MDTVFAAFTKTAAATPRRPAIFWGDETIRYRDLQDRIASVAGQLERRWGIQRGDRVGLLIRNCPEFVSVLYGVLGLGAVAVPINTFLKLPEIQHITADCQLKCLIVSPDCEELAGGLAGLSIGRLAEVENTAPPPARWAEVALQDLAVIIYTSGTTGRPKGAMLTHGNFAANVNSCIQALEETPADRMTLLLPMFHSFMLTVCIFTPLSMGAAIVLIKSVQPFKLALREMIRRRATILVAIPQIFQALAQAKLPFWVHWLLRFRLAVSGAAPLPQETLATFKRRFRFPLLEGYGLSEAAPVVSFNPIHGVRKAGTVGLPLPDVDVAILDDEGRELPQGQVGEIAVRGPNVMRGYYNQPAETAAALRNGWLWTGDMGMKDAAGYLTIVDRRKEMYLVRGLNVYPREIEEVLYQFPGVQEAAVVAKRDEKRGETSVAFVVPVAGAQLEPAAIQKFCRERLADYKLPREVRVLAALPRTATGKVAKLELKNLL